MPVTLHYRKDFLAADTMAVAAASAQLTSVSQVQDAARLLMQPQSTRRASKLPSVQVAQRILLTEQQLTKEFGVEFFPFISFSVVSTSLTMLDLSFNELDDKFWLHFTDLQGAVWPALNTLNLANNQCVVLLPYNTISYVHSGLILLVLMLCRFSARGLKTIAAFITRCPGLTELDLSLNLLCDENSSSDWILPLIRALDEKDRVHLQVLDMSCTGMTDLNISQLVQTDFTKYITKLYLRSNTLTDEAAMTLGNALQWIELEVLSLPGNTIGDCGAASLAFVLDQTSALQTLDLEENQVR